MERRVVYTSDAPSPVGAYSQAIAAGELVFTAGQIPLDPQTGEMIEGPFAEQADRAVGNLLAVLAAEGLDARHVVKATVFLVDAADGSAANKVFARHFGDAPPARSTVIVAALPMGARFEIEAIAAR
jgi:2-iminobutanoate/2-iminopropanoate deaminase